MALGTIYGSTGNEYIDAKIEWSSSPNNSTNKSTVTAALYYKRNNTGYETYGTGTFSITINGEKKTETKALSITESGWVKAIENTVTVDHNSDGAKSVYISASGSIPGTSLTSTDVSDSVKLDTIPRASTIDYLSCDSKYFNGKFTFKYTPKSANYYNRCAITLNINGSHTAIKTISLGKKAASQQTEAVTLSESELATIYNKFPNSTQGTLRFTFSTYSDSGYTSLIGDVPNKEITLNIPNDASTQPIVTSMSLSPSSSLASPYNSLYIQGHSKVKASLDYRAKYGATIVASSITVNGISYASPCESGILSQSGKVTVKATVKDSRGFYGTYYKEIEVIPYSKPYVRAKSGENSIIVARCDSSANFTDDGTYLKIKAKAVYSKIVTSGIQNNYGSIKFRYRKEGGAYSSWQTILNCKTDKSDEVITPPLLNGALDVTSNYQVQVIASDDLYDSEPYTVAIASDAVYMDRPAGGKSMGLGGYSSGDGNLDVYWKTIARGGLSMLDSKGVEIPLGTTMPIPRDQIAEGWSPDNVESGVYVVAKNIGIQSNGNTIMSNGVLIQMSGTVGGNVKVQLALPVDANRNPMYRICWYNNWSDWRAMKL